MFLPHAQDKGPHHLNKSFEPQLSSLKCESPSTCSLKGSFQRIVEAEGFEPTISCFRRRRPLQTGPHLELEIRDQKSEVRGQKPVLCF